MLFHWPDWLSRALLYPRLTLNSEKSPNGKVNVLPEFQDVVSLKFPFPFG